MIYTVDISADGTEWHEEHTSGMDWMEVARDFYEQGYFVNIWDENEVLVWRDGRVANVFYQLSPFEQEWMRMFGNMAVSYCGSVEEES